MSRRSLIAGVLGAVALGAPSSSPAQGTVTVRIATQSPRSTDEAARGEAIRQGAQLAVEQLAAPLGRMGVRVELLAFDDRGRADVAVANARHIVADREILAVIGHPDGATAIPASEIYREALLPMIAPAGTSTLLTDRSLPSVSRVCGRDDIQGVVAAGFAATSLAAESAYVLHDGTTAGQDAAELFRAEAGRRGLRVLGLDTLLPAADPDPIVGALRARSPDLVFFAGRHDMVAPFWRRAREQGVRARLLGTDGLDSPAFARDAGAAAVGALYVSTAGAAPAAVPRAAAFREDFRRRFGRPPGVPAAEAYDAAAIALQAIEGVARDGTPTRDAVARAIRKTKHLGATGEIEFDARGDRARAPYVVLQVGSEDPGRWPQNRILGQVTAAPSRSEAGLPRRASP